MSVFSYNSVTLPYVTVQTFDQTTVRESSDTDWILTKFDIKLNFVLNTNYLSVVAPTLVGKTSNPTDIVRSIRASLMKHRKTLSFKFNGVELIPPDTAGVGTVDAKNGPIPQSFSYTMMTNTTFLCTYHIIAHYWENNVATGSSPFVTNQPGSPVLYNRWSETVVIDKHNFSTKTRSGVFAIRSDNAEGKIADQLRTQMAVLSVPQGFNRESSQYVLNPDGLSLQYTIIDKEVFRHPPSPSFEAKGSYKESATTALGKRYAVCSVTLHGDKATPQNHLIEQAVRIVTQKLVNRAIDVNPTVLAGGLVIQNAELDVNLYENNVSFNMKVLLFPSNPQLNAGGIPINAFAGYTTDVPGSEDDPDYVPPYLDRGTASILLQAAVYNDPSIKNAGLGVGNEISPENAFTTTNQEKFQIRQGTNLEVGKGGVSNGTQ